MPVYKEQEEPKKSKIKLILTWGVTLILTITLIIGGVLGYFGNKTHSFITVDGKEVLTESLIQSIQSQLNQSIGAQKQQAFYQAMQFLTQLQNSASWEAFSHKQKVNFSARDIEVAMKSIYKEQQKQYEKQTNNPFPFNYNQFVERNTDSFNLAIFSTAITTPLEVSNLDIQNEYFIQNTMSQIQYFNIPVKDYLIEKKLTKVQQFYKNTPSQNITLQKIVYVSEFPSDKEAIDFITQAKTNKQLISSTFTPALPKLMISRYENNDIYRIIKNTDVQKITPSFEYEGKFYVGKVVKNVKALFDQLDSADKQAVALKYFHSLKPKQKQTITDSIKTLLNSNQSSLIKTGESEPFNMSQEFDVKDSISKKPLSFASFNNKELIIQAFQKEGTLSKATVFKDSVYKIKILKRIKASFPIPEDTKKSIAQDIKNRELELWKKYNQTLMAENIEVNVNYKNITELFNI